MYNYVWQLNYVYKQLCLDFSVSTTEIQHTAEFEINEKHPEILTASSMSIGYITFGALAGICLVLGIVALGVIIKKKRKSKFKEVSELDWIEDNG